MTGNAPILRLALAALLALVSFAFPPAVHAQPKPAPTATATAAPRGDNGHGNGNGNGSADAEAAPDSPRASMRQYVELCRAGEYQEAARYLDLPAGKVDGAGLARRLKSVLDRHLWNDVDLAQLASPSSMGRVDDKLPAGVDELGTIPGPRGPEPVRIVRRAGPQTTIWVFTRSTVERVDIWYARLEERWLLDRLPEPLLRPGPFDILYWQYIALPFLAAAAWALGRVLGFLTRKLITKVAARTGSRWDDEVIGRMGPPLTLAWGLAVFAIFVVRLRLYDPAHETMQKVIRAGFLIALFWGVMRALNVARAYMLEVAAPGRASARSLIPLGTQVIKVLVLMAAAAMVLSELGYPVASLIAGLGIGGIAIALAAQKTVENLFGSVSIGVDQPFQVGDFIKVEDVTGTVETVGLRSTRIRTLDRTLVTIPNGKLSEMRIECFAVRDRYRLAALLGVVYSTTAAQLREIVRGIDEALRAEPTLNKDGHTVVIKELGASSINIEVMAWFDTVDFSTFAKVREDLLLKFIEVVEKNGSSFAFPTQTLHLVAPADPRPAPGGAAPAGGLRDSSG